MVNVMNRKWFCLQSLSCKIIVISQILILLAMLSVFTVAFDLNELPADEETSESMPLSGQQQEAKSQVIIKPVKPKITQAQYAKILSLFKILAVCDSKSFNIKTVHIPDSFAKENKAMMALKEVAKRNLIAKQDKERYDRMMKNCSLLSKAVNEKTDQALGPESQMSGGNEEDLEAERVYKLRNSPLDSFESRFSGLQAREKKMSYLDNIPTSTTTTTTTTTPIPLQVADNGLNFFMFI